MDSARDFTFGELLALAMEDADFAAGRITAAEFFRRWIRPGVNGEPCLPMAAERDGQMGLDVYLYRYEDFEAHQKLEAEVEAFSKSFSDDDYDTMKKARAEKFGNQVDEWGGVIVGKEQITINSKVHPDHLFKIGYLRSSYNDGGVNRILRSTLGKDLYYIFQPEERYQFKPDWGTCLKRALEVRDEFARHIEANGAFRIITVWANPLLDGTELPASDAAALKTFLEVRARNPPPAKEHPLWGGDFSSREGEFFLSPAALRVRALIPGISTVIGARPCTYVVYEDDEHFAWYRQALEINVEMCEWVLGQPDVNKLVLHWSA